MTATATRESLLHGFADLTDMNQLSALEQERQERMIEVYAIKDRLARDGCPTPLKVIKNALLMPEEAARVATKFSYPDVRLSLMPNPWPKKKKGKKGKKGKKK